jgi:hypothetical protein
MSVTIDIRGIVLARVVQMIKSPTGTVGYLPDVAGQIKAKYEFLVGPTNDELVPKDPAKGAEFRHGRIIHEGQSVVIDKVTVFNDGIVVDSTSSTNDADLFLDDLVVWAKTAIPKASASGPRYYLSQIEFHSDLALVTYAPTFEPICEKITATLTTYGIKAPRFEVTNIGLYYDMLGKINPQPGAFYIDRRQNVAFAENVWFSQAPLKTPDHIALLKELED